MQRFKKWFWSIVEKMGEMERQDLVRPPPASPHPHPAPKPTELNQIARKLPNYVGALGRYRDNGLLSAGLQGAISLTVGSVRETVLNYFILIGRYRGQLIQQPIKTT